MGQIIELLKLIPKPVQVVIAALLLGAGFAYAHEVRYMTVADFTKSYVLDLKKIIRELKNELHDEDLSDRDRLNLEMDIEELIDELCYENPNDRLCDDEEES